MVKRIIDIQYFIEEKILKEVDGEEVDAEEAGDEQENPEEEESGDQETKSKPVKNKQDSGENEKSDKDEVSKEEDVEISFYDTFSQFTEEFQEHFKMFANIEEEKSLFKDNAGVIIFPAEKGIRFEILFVDNKDSDDNEAFVKTFVYKDGQRKRIEEVRFPKKDMESYINTPESLFPSKKLEDFIGKKNEQSN